MSEHTKTPWLIVPGKAFIYALDENGVNRFQASIDGAHCPESELAANARHIVQCVNNHERLVEALRNLTRACNNKLVPEEQHWIIDQLDDARALLAALEAEKGGGVSCE